MVRSTLCSNNYSSQKIHSCLINSYRYHICQCVKRGKLRVQIWSELYISYCMLRKSTATNFLLHQKFKLHIDILKSMFHVHISKYLAWWSKVFLIEETKRLHEPKKAYCHNIKVMHEDSPGKSFSRIFHSPWIFFAQFFWSHQRSKIRIASNIYTKVWIWKC